MHRQTLVLTAVAVVSLLLGVGGYQLLSPGQPEPTTTQLPESLAAIPLTDVEGNDSLLGDRPEDFLIINFWAPWCAPCRREIPALIDIHQAFADQGVSVLGIAFDGKDAVSGFADDYNINFPLFLAGARIAMYNTAFGNSSGGLPFTAIINQQRKRVFHHSGEITREALIEALSAAGVDTSASL